MSKVSVCAPVTGPAASDRAADGTPHARQPRPEPGLPEGKPCSQCGRKGTAWYTLDF